PSRSEADPSEIYTLSLHDALPIWSHSRCHVNMGPLVGGGEQLCGDAENSPISNGRRFHAVVAGPDLANHPRQPLVPAPDSDDVRDRKSTRLNSSHVAISYAVFCLK